jgi:hypothetical protein
MNAEVDPAIINGRIDLTGEEPLAPRIDQALCGQLVALGRECNDLGLQRAIAHAFQFPSNQFSLIQSERRSACAYSNRLRGFHFCSVPEMTFS